MDLSPINNLSFELLSNVFLSTGDEAITSGSVLVPLIHSSVCQTWRHHIRDNIRIALAIELSDILSVSCEHDSPLAICLHAEQRELH